MSLFELSVSLRYLLPKRRQLSSTFIGQLSLLVISLVVWLILVFFSVSYGLEDTWTHKFTNVVPPIRLVPTQDYYQSYYYNIDRYSDASFYSLKSLEEKKASVRPNPYDPAVDGELPDTLSPPLLSSEGELIDLVNEAFATLEKVPGITSYIQTAAFAPFIPDPSQESKVPTHYALFSSIDPNNQRLSLSLITSSDKEEKTWPLPVLSDGSYGVLVPKSYKDLGLTEGSRLYFHENTENGPKGFVAGFYDPGIFPMGNRVVIAPSELIASLGSAPLTDQSEIADSIGVRTENLRSVDEIAAYIKQELETKGIAPYWKVETFRDLPYVEQILRQLQSEKLLFSIISLIILAVATSNIVSMLFILVHDKKTEIGIYRALGLSAPRVAAIFLIAGALLGLASALFGLLLAAFTLNHLDVLIGWISYWQGFELFNHNIFGEELPNTLYAPVVYTTFLAVLLLSSLSALLPAIQASLYNPSDILKEK
jgi:lipoprotein-releasing system permease protein